MRILIIAPPWVTVPPSGYGGTEAVLDTLARGIKQAGHDVLLFTTGDSTCAVPRASIWPHAIGVGVGGVATEIRHVIHAYQHAADVDLVHDHTLAGPVYAQQFPALPVVTTNHGPFDSELGDYYEAIGGRTPVIAISHDQRSKARGVPVAAVIHHGVDCDRFPVGAGKGGYALFLGRMCPEKGVEAAIRAARAAGVRLRIAAKMTEAAEQLYFERKILPLLGGDVEYVGEVGGAEKLQLIGEAVCLLNPIAWSEPFGMVMIESLACGTPVVVTPRGAAAEIVDDGVTGFICSGTDAIARAVRAATDLDRSQCRDAVERRFSMPRMVAEHLDLYRSVIGGSIRPEAAPDVRSIRGFGSRPGAHGRAESRSGGPERDVDRPAAHNGDRAAF